MLEFYNGECIIRTRGISFILNELKFTHWVLLMIESEQSEFQIESESQSTTELESKNKNESEIKLEIKSESYHSFEEFRK